MSPPDKLTPTDPRVEHHTVLLPHSNHTYHYLLATPPRSSTPPSGTVLLIHGWPDLSLGWRYQVPALLALNLRVIIPDMLGYGQTDAPSDIAAYSFKSICADLAGLLTHVLGDNHAPVILGGHDWGGAVVWRFALWYPHLTRAVFSVCTPFAPPMGSYISKEAVVATVLPSFKYQLQLAGPEVEATVVGEEKIGQFLRGMFGATTPSGGRSFDTDRGVVFENLSALGKSKLLTPEEEAFYVREYARRGNLRGPLNWYRTWDVNYEEERELVEKGRVRVTVPSMFVAAKRDVALPPSMAEGMERHFEKGGLVRREVDANHWGLVEAAGEVNGCIEEFVGGVLGGRGG
ncbi:Alpha/Beta hydrolase protein [Cercophora scortea]|uniref:Alpha/Beta hydrolase protein n=1 Tax=Cercophora scortea TaxID=314031 RepID=A0AAE0IYI8_9PEZI|nr:Alpha/Beta hydrolase protein [Cercophora scortea]